MSSYLNSFGKYSAIRRLTVKFRDNACVVSFSCVIKNSISGGLTASEYMGEKPSVYLIAPAKSYAALAEEIKERV